MSEGLAATHIEGIKTTVPLLARLVTDPRFEAVEHWTTYIETEMPSPGGAR